MLTFKIKETGETKTLSLIDPKTGHDYIADFMGNADGLAGLSETEDGDYLINECDYSWWVNVVEATQKADNLEFEYKDALSDEIKEELYQANFNDFDEVASAKISIIEKAIA